MKPTMRFAGGEQLARNLAKLPFALSLTVQVKALKAGGEPMRARAEQLAPRSPGADFFGHLQDHIVIQRVNRVGSISGGRWEERLGEAWVAVGPALPYFWGIFQEYGTQHHAAQPFLRPAFDTEGPKALPIIATALWQALHKAIPPVTASSTSGRRAA